MKRIFHILLLLGLVLTTWAQGTSALEHQFIARQMYNNFPEVFKNGGDDLRPVPLLPLAGLQEVLYRPL
jgi:hypothetical protein